MINGASVRDLVTVRLNETCLVGGLITKMLDPNGIVSDAERKRRQQEAVTKGAIQGITGGALAGFGIGVAHFVLTRFSPAYARLSVVPKRIAGAVLVAATFGFQSQRTAGEMAQYYGDIDSQAIAKRDEEAEAAFRKRTTGR